MSDLVIVGAGFAGLAAAYELITKDAANRVTVVEARPDRVGGRVLSLRNFIPGRIIEAGAELIGANHPRWLDFARTLELGLSLITQDDNFAQLGLEQTIRLEDRTYTGKEAEGLARKAHEEIYSPLAEEAKKVPPDQPWNAAGAGELDNMSVEDWLSKSGASDQSKQLVRFELENDQTVSTSNMSLLGLLAAIQGGGGETFWDTVEVFRCEGGNQAGAVPTNGTV
jgi:monoamine oxidase